LSHSERLTQFRTILKGRTSNHDTIVPPRALCRRGRHPAAGCASPLLVSFSPATTPVARAQSAPPPAAANPTTETLPPVSLELQDVPYTTAIAELFDKAKAANITYTLADDVRGSVTITVRERRSRTRSANCSVSLIPPLTYTKRGNVYEIRSLPPVPRLSVDEKNASVRGLLDRLLTHAKVRHVLADDVRGRSRNRSASCRSKTPWPESRGQRGHA
jgi:hypothetical protein